MRFMYELHKGCFRDNGVEMSIKDVLDTLNEQHEENENLKKQNETLKKINARLQNKIAFNDQHYGERVRKSFEGIEDWASGGH